MYLDWKIEDSDRVRVPALKLSSMCTYVISHIPIAAVDPGFAWGMEGE